MATYLWSDRQNVQRADDAIRELKMFNQTPPPPYFSRLATERHLSHATALIYAVPLCQNVKEHYQAVCPIGGEGGIEPPLMQVHARCSVYGSFSPCLTLKLFSKTFDERRTKKT